jgi:hypothetical protein
MLMPVLNVVICTVIVIIANRSTYTYVYISQNFNKPFAHQLTNTVMIKTVLPHGTPSNMDKESSKGKTH